jgi:hypothetical protein
LQQAIEIALGVVDFQLDAQIVGHRLHEARITDPEGFTGIPGIDEGHPRGGHRWGGHGGNRHPAEDQSSDYMPH